MSFITAIGTSNPAFKVEQERIASFMVKAMGLDYTNARRLRTVFRSSGIDYRYSVLKDYGLEKNFEFYSNTDDFEPFPSTEKRSAVFKKHALPLSLQAIRNAISDKQISGVTHLITVCCTGLYAPGLDIEIIKALRLPKDIHRIGINFMGCYAAINALRTADSFCKADPSAKVLIVCTELCSLHFQKNPTDDNLLSNALFGDGSAALLMEATTANRKALIPAKFHMDLLFEGEQDMAWNVGDFGFEMRLSSYVPDLIEKGIRQLTASLMNGIQKDLSAIKYYAMHPGGKKILKVIEQKLNISKQQNEFAHVVLRNYGNMSSPSVLFVLYEIFKIISEEDHNENILSFAFGPGLTLGSLLLQIKSA